MVLAEHVDATFGDNADRARRYAELLGTVAVERGLIGPREVDRIWGRHMFNSAAVAQLIPEHADLVDLGSGAGLPGIPVALARPDLEVTLLEPMARRVGFLTECLAELALPRVTVHHGRAQDGIPKPATVVVARAVAPLAELATLARPLAAPAGTLLALKGAKAAAELEVFVSSGAGSGRVHALVDGAGEAATVVEVHWHPKHGRKTP